MPSKIINQPKVYYSSCLSSSQISQCLRTSHPTGLTRRRHRCTSGLICHNPQSRSFSAEGTPLLLVGVCWVFGGSLADGDGEGRWGQASSLVSRGRLPRIDAEADRWRWWLCFLEVGDVCGDDSGVPKSALVFMPFWFWFWFWALDSDASL